MILVVDDDESIARAISSVLQLNGYSVAIAGSCDEALGYLDENRPSLVFSDVNMPTHDGFELLRIIKSNPVTQNIPVVFVSAQARADDRERALKAGVTAYLEKPFDPGRLINAVKEYALVEA